MLVSLNTEEGAEGGGREGGREGGRGRGRTEGRGNVYPINILPLN